MLYSQCLRGGVAKLTVTQWGFFFVNEKRQSQGVRFFPPNFSTWLLRRSMVISKRLQQPDRGSIKSALKSKNGSNSHAFYSAPPPLTTSQIIALNKSRENSKDALKAWVSKTFYRYSIGILIFAFNANVSFSYKVLRK